MNRYHHCTRSDLGIRWIYILWVRMRARVLKIPWIVCVFPLLRSQGKKEREKERGKLSWMEYTTDDLSVMGFADDDRQHTTHGDLGRNSDGGGIRCSLPGSINLRLIFLKFSAWFPQIACLSAPNLSQLFDSKLRADNK